MTDVLEPVPGSGAGATFPALLLSALPTEPVAGLIFVLVGSVPGVTDVVADSGRNPREVFTWEVLLLFWPEDDTDPPGTSLPVKAVPAAPALPDFR